MTAIATPTTNTGPTSTGLTANVAGLLAYVLGPFTGMLFLVIEKENRFVRFHAAQSVAVSLAIIALSIAFSVLSSLLVVVPVAGWIIALLAGVVFSLVTFVLWIVLMLRAFQAREWEVPMIGRLARSFIMTPT